MVDTSLGALITSLREQRANINAKLLEDSLNPVPSYSVGGQSVNRTEWRKSLLDQMKGINEQLIALQPTEIRSVGL